MDEHKFISGAVNAGFSAQQAKFLWENTAQKPHTHLSDEIIVDAEDGETLEQFVDAVSETLADEDEPEEVED